MLKNLVEGSSAVEVQETTLALDVLGRYVCNTYDEAVNNGGFPFDAVVIGAGMYGAYIADKLYRKGQNNLRVLTLEAGGFLVSEHVQNLARIGLNAAAPVATDPGVARERVWGLPWRSNVAFPGLAYCIGGRSLYWGGWSPRLTDKDLLSNWPPELASFLKTNYNDTERETGVDPTTDYISGELFQALMARANAVRSSVPTIDAIEEAPLAVQGASPASGLFSFDKFSSAPILTDAVRQAAADPDPLRKLFVVPRVHVVKLHNSGGVITAIEMRVNGQQQFLGVPRDCAVVLANGTIEATRLALESFPTALMGKNLMAHVRSNTTVRIKRSTLPPVPQQLQAAAFLVRGSTPQGRYHLQVTAAAVNSPDAESTMWRMVPDIDVLDSLLKSQQASTITITFRGIGEMIGDKKATSSDPSTSWMDLSPFESDEFGMRRAFVNLVATSRDQQLWNTMDQAAIQLAQAMAGSPGNIEYFYDTAWHTAPPPAGKVRDGLGTTHHEAGTLWAGSDANASVTNLDGRFHHIQNSYVAGPAVFPSLGSANPSLTAFTMARRTAQAIIAQALPAPQAGELSLITPNLDGWQMAGAGRFNVVGNGTVESQDGIGLLWYTKREFSDFVLTVQWRSINFFDNSGVFIRFPVLGNSDPANDWRLATDQGYEIQIDDTGFDPNTNTTGSLSHITGAVYQLAPATMLNSRPLGEWNDYEITAVGADIQVKLNGKVVSHLVGNHGRPLKGHIGLQNHHPGSRVQFRNLFVKAAGAAAALGAAG